MFETSSSACALPPAPSSGAASVAQSTGNAAARRAEATARDPAARRPAGRFPGRRRGVASALQVHNSLLPAMAPDADKRSISVSQFPDCLTTSRPAHTIPRAGGPNPSTRAES